MKPFAFLTGLFNRTFGQKSVAAAKCTVIITTNSQKQDAIDPDQKINQKIASMLNDLWMNPKIDDLEAAAMMLSLVIDIPFGAGLEPLKKLLPSLGFLPKRLKYKKPFPKVIPPEFQSNKLYFALWQQARNKGVPDRVLMHFATSDIMYDEIEPVWSFLREAMSPRAFQILRRMRHIIENGLARRTFFNPTGQELPIPSSRDNFPMRIG